MKNRHIVFLSLILSLAACSDPAPAARVIKVMKVTDSGGQEHIIKEPEVDYTNFSHSGNYGSGDSETDGMRTVEQLLPWSDIKRLQIGKAGTRNTDNIPGNVPGYNIRDLRHAEVQLPSGATRNVVLLDTADGWLQGNGALGRIFIKLRDVQALDLLPDEKTTAKFAAQAALPRLVNLRITPDEGSPYEALESFRFSMEKTHLRIVSDQTEPGLKVYVGKAVVALPWAGLKQVDISGKDKYALERSAEVTFADGQRRQYQLYAPSQFHLEASSKTLAGMKTIVVSDVPNASSDAASR